jgi:hypothetical protein
MPPLAGGLNAETAISNADRKMHRQRFHRLAEQVPGLNRFA